MTVYCSVFNKERICTSGGHNLGKVPDWSKIFYSIMPLQFKGDSGGPLMVQKNDHFTLIGVMSFIRVGGSLWRWLRNIRVEVFIRIFISQFQYFTISRAMVPYPAIKHG